jgi:TolB-like protein
MPILSRWPAIVLAVSISVFAPAQQPTNTTPHDIHRGAKVFVDKMDGFEEYFIAALHSKQVPVTVVMNKDIADFVVSGSAESNGKHVRATLKAVNKNGEVAFACAFDDDYALHGKQSAAESCAKRLKKEVWE